MGHPSFLKLKEVLPWINLCGFKCESCELGKHHRSSYLVRMGLPFSRPFDLVHCDIWGLAQQVSPSGGRYYIIFVDDYTRVSWTYIIKTQKEVLDKVHQFIIEITTQYSTTPKVLRIHNALEFTQIALQEFYDGKGILHQTTCLYTSQQNEVAERKHRYLLDMVRTMLVGMNVPMYLWSDVVLTGTFLVNRLQSTTLNGAILVQRLIPKVELFSLPPRVFECTAFVQEHTPRLSKLDPRALKGIFMVTLRIRKGYCVYFPST